MKSIRRILFPGNSITKHSPKPGTGWEGDWGMAASAPGNDYVHKPMSRIHAVDPTVRFPVKNIAEFERGLWSYDISLRKECRDYQADLAIMRIAENADEEQAKTRGFSKCCEQLIRYINSRSGIVLCTDGF